MHEAAISQALIDQLATLAAENGWARLRRVVLRIGLLSGVVPDALDFAFSALSAGTPAEGAELVMRTDPARFSCETCGEIEMLELDFTCPQCAGSLCLIEAGRELLLCEVEPVISRIQPNKTYV